MDFLTVKNVYTFDTIAPNIIGARYTGMKLKDILSFERAIVIRDDIVNINQIIKDNIPNAANLVARDLTYYSFKDIYGNTLILAKEWIDLESAVLVESIKANIVLESITSDDLIIINNRFKELGYNDFVISIIE
jgi:hypothetical protein